MTNTKSQARELADTPFALRDGRWNFAADDELCRLSVLCDELKAENARLAAELDRLKSDQQSRFCPECEARGRAAARWREPTDIEEAAAFVRVAFGDGAFHFNEGIDALRDELVRRITSSKEGQSNEPR